jgi:hypothetical protein
MGFGWPLGLAALATLLVPLVIHLARRRPRQPVLVGSLQHLPRATAPRRARSRLIEPWLLALRSLVLALLAFVTAGAFVRAGPPAATPRSLLALPAGVPEDSLRRLLPVIDSLMTAGHEVRRLPMADLWSELAELDAGLSAGSTIAVAAPLTLGVAGARPALRSTVVLHRFEMRREREGISAPRTLHVQIVADSSTRIAGTRHAAAFRAVAELRGDSLVLSDAAGRDGWIVWLPDSLPPRRVLDEVRAGATLMMRAANGPGSALAEEIEVESLGRGRIVSADFVANPAVDATFPELIARIWPEPASLAPTRPGPGRISTTQLLPALGSGDHRPGAAPRSLSRMLLGMALVVFLAERWLSHRPPGARAA